jgi:polar amino acid transport system substrate-binding protein
MRAIAVALVVLAASALPASAAAPPTKQPGMLTVALSMPSAGFQVGAVRGRTVILAKGLEIDLAREVAKRLGLKRVRFLNEARFSTLLKAGPKDWDVALAEITVTPERARRVDFSIPYFEADQGVLVRGDLTPLPRSIAALRKLVLCAERGTTGGALVANRIKPARKPLFVENPSRLSYDLFAKRCDAVVADAPALAVLRRQAPDRYGPLAGRIVTHERYAIALEKGSPLRAQVNAALSAITKEGILVRLRRQWLGADTSKLPVLR